MVKKLSDAQILNQIPRARRRTIVQESAPWWPKAVEFDQQRDAVRLKLSNGVEWVVPRKALPELKGRSPAELRRVEIAGEAIRWQALDVDISIFGIALQTLGPAFFAKVTGRIRGSVKTRAKAAAARANGAKGGRPAKKRAAGPHDP